MESIGEASDDACIFCDKPRAGDDAGNLILRRGERAFVLMNLYPYNGGHLLIAPYTHVAELETLAHDDLVEMLELSVAATRALRLTLRPDGFNIGMNIGRTAGAGIDQHVHLHIVPRWNGDTNFMSVVGQTKVLPETLETTYARLRAVFHIA